MSIVDFFTSTKRPLANTPILPVDQLKQRILSLNRPTAPYQIIDGISEGADLIAEWKIVDAQWYQIFAKAGLTDVFKIYMKFHPETHEVKTKDKRFTVEWEVGIPTLRISVSSFSGQMQMKEFGTEYAFTENFQPGQVYSYRFETSEIKGPIQKTVANAGWVYKRVVFGSI